MSAICLLALGLSLFSVSLLSFNNAQAFALCSFPLFSLLPPNSQKHSTHTQETSNNHTHSVVTEQLHHKGVSVHSVTATTEKPFSALVKNLEQLTSSRHVQG